MGKIAGFLMKWAFAIVLCLAAITLVDALGCCIHTAIARPFFGITGAAGVCIALAVVISFIVVEIKEGA